MELKDGNGFLHSEQELHFPWCVGVIGHKSMENEVQAVKIKFREELSQARLQ